MKTATPITLIRRLGVVCFLLMLAAGSALAQTSVAAVGFAQEDIRNGNYLTAINRLKLVVDLGNRKEKAIAYYWFGYAKYLYALQQQENSNLVDFNRLIPEAAQAFQTGITNNPELGLNYTGLGYTQVQQAKYPDAKANFKKASDLALNDVPQLIAIAEGYMSIYNVRSLAQTERGEALSEAKKLLTRADGIDANNADIKIALGSLYESSGVLASAETYYREATQKAPSNPRAHHMLGKMLNRQQKYNEALTAFLAAKNADSRYAPVYVDIANLYMLAQKYDLAKQELEAYRNLIRESGGDATYANAQYGISLYFIKKYKEAAVELETVLRDTTSIVLQRLYGYSLAEDQQYEKAKGVLDKLMEMTAATPELRIAKDYKYMGIVLNKLSQQDAAIEAFKKALEMQPDIDGIHKVLFEIYKAKENWAEAVASLKKEYAQSQSTNDLYLIAFYSYSKIKAHKEADSLLGIVIQKAPTFIDAHFNRAMNAIQIENYVDTARRGMAVPYFEAMLAQMQSQNQMEGANNIKKLKPAYEYLAIQAYKGGNDARCFELLTKLKAIDPENGTVKQLLPFVQPGGTGSGTVEGN